MTPGAAPDIEPFILLGLALALGLLIGTERGWRERETPEGGRIAGIRTFGLIGFLGGLWGLLGDVFGQFLLGFAFLAVAAVLIFAHMEETRTSRDMGITTVVAALVTFALGAVAVSGNAGIAAAGAVVTVTLLSLKPMLHGWLRRIEHRDLLAGIKLLLISVVILPVLPNEGYGPWEALNPFEIWLMVVLIAGLSFAGYVAIKLAGAQRGILFTGLFGGLVSSTATTLSLARLARDGGSYVLPAAGIVLASAVMLPRMLVIATVINPALLPGLLLPAGLMIVVLGAAAVILARRRGDGSEGSDLKLSNPMELRVALTFGAILAVVILVATALHEWLGAGGVYIAAAISGIADVDAITISLARMAREAEDAGAMMHGIVIAVLVNTLFKGLLAAGIAGRGMALRVLPAMLPAIAAGAAGVFLLA